MLHVVDDASGVAVRLLLLVARTLVLEADLEAAVQKRHHLQPLEDRLGTEFDLFEDRRVGPERDARAGAPPRSVADHFERADRRAPVAKLHPVPLAVPVHFEHEPPGEGVHDRDADAVQAARDLVAGAAELAPGMQHREHHLGSRLVLVARVTVDRDAPPVVNHPAAAVGEQSDVDAGAVAGHRLVDRVVHHLRHEMVETARTGRADVHAGPLADRVEALEDRDVDGVVRRRRLGRPICCLPRGLKQQARPSLVTSGYGRQTPAALAAGRSAMTLILPAHDAHPGHAKQRHPHLRANGFPAHERGPRPGGTTCAEIFRGDEGPSLSASRPSSSAEDSCTWVAQAGWSTSTISSSPLSDRGEM